MKPEYASEVRHTTSDVFPIWQHDHFKIMITKSKKFAVDLNIISLLYTLFHINFTRERVKILHEISFDVQCQLVPRRKLEVICRTRTCQKIWQVCLVLEKLFNSLTHFCLIVSLYGWSLLRSGSPSLRRNYFSLFNQTQPSFCKLLTKGLWWDLQFSLTLIENQLDLYWLLCLNLLLLVVWIFNNILF